MPERSLSDAMPALLRPGGLQDQVEAVLRRKLATDPHDTDALWKLAEVWRRLGNFAAARDVYRRLRVSGPDRCKAAWLHAILSGDGVPEVAPPPGVRPVPFVRMTNFLTPAQCDRLLEVALRRRERFSPVGVIRQDSVRPDPKVRITLEADSRTLSDFRPWFAPKIRNVLPEVLTRLQMASLDRYRLEVWIRVYLTGGFYRVHSDRLSGSGHPRRLSYVYHFHREPRRFCGGDLLLYDMNETIRATSPAAAFSRIVPLRNSVIFFPSSAWHQVTPVQCETNDFGDGRWAVNGHVLPHG